MRRLVPTVLVLALALLAACGTGATESPPPDERPETRLNFLRPAPGATLVVDSVSFWAVAGRNRRGELFYRPRAGRSDSSRFLRFEVDDDTELRRPDGSLVARGDSIRITIRVLDFARLITQFAPSGMRFEGDPAELRLDFGEADGDYDDDGDDDDDDDRVVPQFAIWKQERAGLPWTKLTSVVEISGSLREVKADIRSFTNHAVAW